MTLIKTDDSRETNEISDCCPTTEWFYTGEIFFYGEVEDDTVNIR
jgi:hypothetical protein